MYSPPGRGWGGFRGKPRIHQPQTLSNKTHHSQLTIHYSPFTIHNFTIPLKNYHWYKIAESEAQLDFQENHIALAEVNGKTICIGRYRDDLFAFAHKCPHAGSVLSDGRIDGMGNVICPGHQYKFSLSNGRNVSGEGYYLRHWPVEVREAGVFVGVDV